MALPYAWRDSPAPFFQHPRRLLKRRRSAQDTYLGVRSCDEGRAFGRDCVIGDHCFVESGVRIGHGVTIKNGVSIWEGWKWATMRFSARTPRSQMTCDPGREDTPRLRTVIAADVGCQERASAPAQPSAPTRPCCAASHIGRFAMVAAGSVVTIECPRLRAVGGGARTRSGHVCRCAGRLAFVEVAPSAGHAGWCIRSAEVVVRSRPVAVRASRQSWHSTRPIGSDSVIDVSSARRRRHSCRRRRLVGRHGSG